MIDVVNSFKKYGITRTDLLNDIITALSTTKVYLRDQFPNNISESSECPSHCPIFGLSDPNPEKVKRKDVFYYKGSCSHTHTKICQFCAQIKDTFEVIEELIHSHQAVTGDFQFNKNKFKSSKAMEKIFAYQKHLMAAYVQQREWSTLQEKYLPNQAFVTV